MTTKWIEHDVAPTCSTTTESTVGGGPGYFEEGWVDVPSPSIAVKNFPPLQASTCKAWTPDTQSPDRCAGRPMEGITRQQQGMSTITLQRSSLERLCDSFESLFGIAARLTAQHQQLQLKRDEAGFEASGLRHATRHVTSSQQAVWTRENASALPPLYSDGASLEIQRLLQDHNALADRAEKFLAVESEVGGLEFIAQNEELKFAHAAQDVRENFLRMGFTRPASRVFEGLEGVPSRVPSPPPSAVSSRTPSVVHEYFNKAGHFKDMQHRVPELEEEYEDQRIQRAIMVDQDKPLRTTDEEFEYSYSQQRGDLAKAIANASEDVETARKACFDLNIDPETYRKHRSANDEELDESEDPDCNPDLAEARSNAPFEPFTVPATRFDLLAVIDRGTSSGLLPAAQSWPPINGLPTSQRSTTPKSALVESWIHSISDERKDSGIEELMKKQLHQIPMTDLRKRSPSRNPHQRIRTLDDTDIHHADRIPLLRRSLSDTSISFTKPWPWNSSGVSRSLELRLRRGSGGRLGKD